MGALTNLLSECKPKPRLARESEELRVPEEGQLPGQMDDNGNPVDEAQSLTDLQQEGGQQADEQAQINDNIEQTQDETQDAAVAEVEQQTEQAEAGEPDAGAAEEPAPEPEAEGEPEAEAPPAEEAPEDTTSVDQGEEQLDAQQAEADAGAEQIEKVEKAVVTLERLLTIIDAKEKQYSIESMSFAAEAVNRVSDEVCTEGKGKKATGETALSMAKEAHNRFTRIIAQIFDRILELVGSMFNYIFNNTDSLRKKLRALLSKVGSTPKAEVNIAVNKRMVAASYHGSLQPAEMGKGAQQGIKALNDVTAVLKGMAQELQKPQPGQTSGNKWFYQFKDLSKNEGMITSGVFGMNLFLHNNDAMHPNLIASPIDLKEKGVTINFHIISGFIGHAMNVLDALDKAKPDLTQVTRLLKNASRGGGQIPEGEDQAAFVARARAMQQSLGAINKALYTGAYRFAVAVIRIAKEYVDLAAVGKAAAASVNQSFPEDDGRPVGA